MEFLIKLKAAHDATGLSPYAVSKKTGVSINTIVKYTAHEAVRTGTLWPSVIVLARFYGLDWRNPLVVELVEESPEEEERKTPLSAIA